jgi:hypothetical protein
MEDTHHYRAVKMKCTKRVNPNVNYGHWVIMMCHGKFMNYIDSRRGCVGFRDGIWDLCFLFATAQSLNVSQRLSLQLGTTGRGINLLRGGASSERSLWCAP